MERFERTERLLGAEAMERLRASHVAVFGIGGVGGFAAEALARSGIGAITLVDSDTVSITNINRQIIATEKSIVRYTTDVMKERIADINPQCAVTVHRCFFLPETADGFDFTDYSYVADAVDTVTAKIALILACKAAETPIISSMGAGNKLDPTAFEVTDLYKTSVCPLAKVMRRELKARNVEHLKVVYSKEPPLRPIRGGEEAAVPGKKAVPGSVSFVPSAAGLIMAGEIVKDLINRK